jgi:hypothetical protein
MELRGGGMRIAILTSSNVASKYAATLIMRGHEVIVGDENVRAISGLEPFLECDGCLLLGKETELLDIAEAMQRAGKCVWRDLAKIPK